MWVLNFTLKMEGIWPEAACKYVCDCLHSFWSDFGQNTAVARAWGLLGALPSGQSKSSTSAGQNGHEGLKITMQLLSPPPRCPLQPPSLCIDCLEVSSESMNSRIYYRPNFQAGRYNDVTLPKKLFKQIQQQLERWGFCDTRDTHTMTENEHSHCQSGNYFPHRCELRVKSCKLWVIDLVS